MTASALVATGGLCVWSRSCQPLQNGLHARVQSAVRSRAPRFRSQAEPTGTRRPPPLRGDTGAAHGRQALTGGFGRFWKHLIENDGASTRHAPIAISVAALYDPLASRAPRSMM
jgi:hypothetical protein